MKVGPGTLYKYGAVISKFIAFADAQGVRRLDGVDRKFVWAYVKALRTDGKSDATISNLFLTLGSFYNHLRAIGETKEANPFAAHKLDPKKSEKRDLFSVQDLELIFSDPAIKANRQLYFILLLKLTTAARHEICQLWTDDFTFADGFYTIRFVANKERQQTLKNLPSQRVVYMHELLRRAGFVEYLEGRKLGRLFDVRRPTLKHWSTFTSADFTEHLRRLGIGEKTMYCFRHTANQRLKDKLIGKEMREDLLGQQGEGTNSVI